MLLDCGLEEKGYYYSQILYSCQHHTEIEEYRAQLSVCMRACV